MLGLMDTAREPLALFFSEKTENNCSWLLLRNMWNEGLWLVRHNQLFHSYCAAIIYLQKLQLCLLRYLWCLLCFWASYWNHHKYVSTYIKRMESMGKDCRNPQTHYSMNQGGIPLRMLLCPLKRREQNC